MLKIDKNFKINPFTPQVNKNKTDVGLGIFYTNDMHGDIERISNFKTAHDEFKRTNADIPKLTLASGDCLFGTNKKFNSFIIKIFNKMHLDALSLGNHEFAGGSKNLSELLAKANFKSFSANIDVNKQSPLHRRIKDKKIVKSATFMRDGHKFGIIGVSPFDSYISVIDKAIKVHSIDDTIKSINKEAKKLEKKGIDKIILCSHIGYGENGDLKIARETEGVDIIIGGHSHTIIDGINKTDGENNHKLNLLLSKRKEPVLVTQVGCLNKYVGYLNAIFDDKGILKPEKSINKLIDINKFKESSFVNKLKEEFFGQKSLLAKVKGKYIPKNIYEERYLENPLANCLADSFLWFGKKYGAQTAIFHSASVRGGLSDGSITNYQVKFSMIPFNNELKLVEITEKDLVNILKNTSGALLTKKEDAQLLRCAGMKYTINTDKEYYLNGGKNPIKNLTINKHNINVENPSNRKIKVVMTDYMFSLPATKDILDKYKKSAKKIGNEQDIFIDYLKYKKLINLTSNENRIEFTYKYSSADELRKAKSEIINALTINLNKN